jgi:hypothetical protein
VGVAIAPFLFSSLVRQAREIGVRGTQTLNTAKGAAAIGKEWASLHAPYRGTTLRQSKRIGATVALLLLSCFAALAQDRGDEGGTLGILIITKEGMVLSADSRATFATGHDDKAVKLFKIGPRSGCMVAGRVIGTNPQRTLGWNLPAEIERITALPGMNDDVLSFGGLLASGLQLAIDRGMFEPPQEDVFEDDPEIAAILVAGYHIIEGGHGIPERYMARGQKVRFVKSTVEDIRGSGYRALHSIVSAIPAKDYGVLEVNGPGGFSIFTNGNDTILKSILRGNKSTGSPTISGSFITRDLAHTHELPAIKTYLQMRASRTLDAMTLKQAVELSDVLINEVIRLAGDELGIGGHVDIATITRQQGFEWVPGHSPK